ncbi:hypothetical protein [Psychrobacter sp. I-STPA10]|uniref:hypothetical protein n=1 Tax=Psychrobacter sp. I-STPA10 TaxID=2585769 RepID=UPI001E5D9975|nr:hypothetical protein [Psychrobacter sp. I-STPA10]
MDVNVEFLVGDESNFILDGYKKVYDYLIDKVNLNLLNRTHKLSLDSSSQMGLSPNVGLYGSQQWIENIHNGTIKHSWEVGEITGKSVIGMDDEETIEVLFDSGKTEPIEIYSLNLLPKNTTHYLNTGNKVAVLYLLLPLKNKELVTNISLGVKGYSRSIFRVYIKTQ